MFFIYSLNLKDNSVKILAYTLTSDKVAEEIDAAAKEFIRLEEGGRKAENPYRDLLNNSQLTDDGYFLRHADAGGVDVYLRKTVVITGRIWNTVDVTVTPVYLFRSTESNIRLINAGTTSAASPVHTPSKLGQFCVSASFYTELCDKLRERKQSLELEKCFNEIIQDAEELQTELHKRRECIRDSEKSCDTDSNTDSDTESNGSLPPPPPPPLQTPEIPCVYVEDLTEDSECDCGCNHTESEDSVLVKKLPTINEDDSFSSDESDYSSEYTYEYTNSSSEDDDENTEDENDAEVPVFDYYANVDTVPSNKKLL